MRILLLSLPVLLSVAAAPHAAIAQDNPRGGSLPLSLLDIAPAQLVAAAFAQPYGRALATEFASILRDSADAKCLATKRMTPEQLSQRARAILVRRGTLLWDRQIKTIDRAAFRTYAPARIGRGGLAEIKRLERDPNVQAYLAVEKPILLAYVASVVVENIDRYAMIFRVDLVRRGNPYSSDNQSLIELDPTPSADARLQEMAENDKSGVLEHYLGITAAAQKPLDDAVDPKAAMRFGPGELLADPNQNRDGLAKDLAALCIAGRMSR